MNWQRISHPAPQPLPKPKRFRWFKSYHGFADHPKWRRIANEVGTSTGNVGLTIIKLFEVASAAKPRGSIDDFNAEDWAWSIGVEVAVVDGILDRLEVSEFIVNGQILTWDEKQDDREDATNAIRQRRHREKRKATPAAASNAVTGVTVTHREEENRHFSSMDRLRARRSDVATPKDFSEESSDPDTGPASQARAWLFDRGIFLVMRGCQRGSERYAKNLIQDWLARLNDDADALLNIIVAVAEQGTSGEAYEHFVNQHIASARDLAAGAPRLPLPPRSVGLSGG